LLLGDNLGAQVEAFVADDGVPVWLPGGGDAGLADDLVALLTAEVAPSARLLLGHDMDRAELGSCGGAGRDHAAGQRDAVRADEHAGAGDQLAHLVLGFTAE